MAQFSDAESLLSSEEPQRSFLPLRARAKIAVLGGAVLALGAFVAVSFRASPQTVLAKPVDAIGLSVAVPENCFKHGMYFANLHGGHNMPGTVQTMETSAAACQARCASTDGCEHFTFWPSGGCLLTDVNSYLRAVNVQYSDAIVGPKNCNSTYDYEEEGSASHKYCADVAIFQAPSAGQFACQMMCDGAADCKYYSLWLTGGQNWCMLTASCDTQGEQHGHNIQIWKRKAANTTTTTVTPAVALAVPATTDTAGTNGTMCSAYPACVAVGISEGDCCPNTDKVSLGCCNGFPPVPVTQTADSVPAPQPEPLTSASCSLAPECEKLKLQGNCCPNDAGISLGCCPGGASPATVPVPDVAADSKALCSNNELCKESALEGLCCPNPAGVDLGCCDSQQAKLGAAPPPPVLLPPASTPGPLMTFYMYRVDNDQEYALNGVNMANLNGDTWYLHNEVVISCPRKFGITRLTRFKVSMRATKELYGQSKNFDSFVAFDKAKCTVPGCAELHWKPLGYVVGCSPNDNTRVALPGNPAWYSLPGTCPSKFYFQKTEACNAAEPGGHCTGSDVTGAGDCTYTIEKAGEIRLDELSGIENYNEVCATTGQREYDEATDQGVGTSFWNGKANAAKGKTRVEHIENLFAQKFPQWPAHLEDVPCDSV